MRIDVLYRCGHRGQARDDQADPSCAACGARGIARAFAPPPRIVGVAAGPHVTTQALDPATVAIGETRLVLKAGADGEE